MDKRLERLLQNEVCVLSTSSVRNVPESAVINFALGDPTANEMPVLYFETLRMNRKYANLQLNSQSSVVLYDDKFNEALQMEGRSTELIQDQKRIAKTLLEEKYGSREIYTHPDIRFFKFIPHWCRIQLPGWPPEYITFGERR